LLADTADDSGLDESLVPALLADPQFDFQVQDIFGKPPLLVASPPCWCPPPQTPRREATDETGAGSVLHFDGPESVHALFDFVLNQRYHTVAGCVPLCRWMG